MKAHEPRGDPRIADALRRMEPQFDNRPLTPLVRRIVTAAGPILDAHRPKPTSWWEYAAQWARMLIPLGVTVGLAAGGGIAWVTVVHPMMPPEAEPHALFGVVTNEVSSPELVDFALSTSRWRQSIVAPTQGK